VPARPQRNVRDKHCDRHVSVGDHMQSHTSITYNHIQAIVAALAAPVKRAMSDTTKTDCFILSMLT
jgi:hypothetical protein